MDSTETDTPTGAASELTEGLGGEWRCFHCHDVFTDPAEAALHFGTRIYDEPACRVDAEKLRDLERQLVRYQEEDTDLHREIHRLHAAHRTALMRAEEVGYSRGLRDGLKTPNLK